MNFEQEKKEKKECKVCKTSNLTRFLSFGKMPVANAFLKRENLDREEFFYNMEIGFCENCKMVQLIEIVPYDKYIIPDEYGKTHYAFFSSTSKFMEEHFAQLAGEVEQKFLDDDSKVLEIGSNDGIMLKAFSNRKNILGIEPSQNVAELAISQGIETITEFFTLDLAKKLVSERGKFKSILATNVFLNIIDIHDFLKGIDVLLEDKGIFITEDPYIMDILEKNSYDQIYDEHIWYFSLSSLSNLCKMHGLEVFDAEKQWVHGGSMRVYMCKQGAYEKTTRLREYLEQEKAKKIDTLEPYLKFAENVEKSRQQLTELLLKLKSEGKKIVGYAAASKGTIVLNYCNIGKEILDYISDSTPAKQTTFSPGKHIPIVSPDVFHNDNADYALLGAWNHAKEIMGKEQDFLARGGRFIVHLPEPRILNSSNENKNNKKIELKELKIFANDQGYLFETVRNDDKIFDGEFGQVLVSVINPGVIKGLHKHNKQTDYTTCIKGNIKYVAIKEDKMQEKQEIQTFVIGEKNPILIKVPPGFWHGYMSLANQEATVLHLLDRTYNPKDDDTERKNPLTFGDVWSVKDG